jgi:SAM-dependent methyltransferase
MNSTEWKTGLLGRRDGKRPRDGYEQVGGIFARSDLLAAGQRRWWAGEFSSRANVPHTTSSAEAIIRLRQLERLVATAEIDRSQPVLELGCADGLVTRHLLGLGFERVVSTDIEYPSVVKLDRSLESTQRERVLLVVDDMLRLPFAEASFSTVVAWGVLSVTGEFDRALDRAWGWVAPGGWLLFAEPILESVLVYTMVRGDLAELRRTWKEGTRAAGWETREDRYPVNPLRFYRERLESLPGAVVANAGGISMVPSLVLGGLAQDAAMTEAELAELDELVTDPGFDDLTLWRQAFWLLRKR